MLYSFKCSYYIRALSCAHIRKLQIIEKISGGSVKNHFVMIFDALPNNIFPV